jgi:hypothetical protein
VGADGGFFTFGDAKFHGSLPGRWLQLELGAVYDERVARGRHLGVQGLQQHRPVRGRTGPSWVYSLSASVPLSMINTALAPRPKYQRGFLVGLVPWGSDLDYGLRPSIDAALTRCLG